MASLRITLVALGCAGLLAGVLMSNPAVLGDYHNGATLICSDCHVMHGQQNHGYNPDGTGFFVPVGSGGPFVYLLRDEINDLCLFCHNNSSLAPDVLMENTGKYPLDIRLAGGLNRVGSGSLTYPEAAGHSLDSVANAPGSDPAWNNSDGLNCVDCHHQHGYAGGNNTYRNLVMNAGNAGFNQTVVTYNAGAPGTVDLTKDVYQAAALSYDRLDVQFPEPDTTDSGYATWCMGCHTNFHGAVGGPEIGGSGTPPSHFVRHPNATVNIGDLGGGHSSAGVYSGHTNRVKVMDPAGLWDGTGAELTPSCFSCHKAHGNQNSFGLIFMRGTGTVTEEGDDGNAPRDLCKQCHVQGG